MILFSKGRIFCEVDNQTVLLANYSSPQHFVYNSTLSGLQRMGAVEEIELEKETKIHPHLFKPIKEKIYEMLKNN